MWAAVKRRRLCGFSCCCCFCCWVIILGARGRRRAMWRPLTLVNFWQATLRCLPLLLALQRSERRPTTTTTTAMAATAHSRSHFVIDKGEEAGGGGTLGMGRGGLCQLVHLTLWMQFSFPFGRSEQARGAAASVQHFVLFDNFERKCRNNSLRLPPFPPYEKPLKTHA